MGEVLLIPAALMAFQAALGVLLGIPVEREDQLAGGRGLGVVALRGFLGVGVRLAWTVAHFTTGDGVLLNRLDRGVMRLIEFSDSAL